MHGWTKDFQIQKTYRQTGYVEEGTQRIVIFLNFITGYLREPLAEREGNGREPNSKGDYGLALQSYLSRTSIISVNTKMWDANHGCMRFPRK